jgi:hypothetical protein
VHGEADFLPAAPEGDAAYTNGYFLAKTQQIMKK